MDFPVTPYRICTGIFIKIYCCQRTQLAPRENGRICMFILDIIRQNEYSFRQLNELIETNCGSTTILSLFKKFVDDVTDDINNLFDLVKDMRENTIESNSVAGLYLRKLSLYLDRLTHHACSKLHDDLSAYIKWQIPRTTRSSVPTETLETDKTRSIYHINQETMRLQANENKAMMPKELYESLRRSSNSSKSDALFLRYLNLLRINESVGSKNLLMAYFDIMSDSVPLSYSALNHAI